MGGVAVAAVEVGVGVHAKGTLYVMRHPAALMDYIRMQAVKTSHCVTALTLAAISAMTSTNTNLVSLIVMRDPIMFVSKTMTWTSACQRNATTH